MIDEIQETRLLVESLLKTKHYQRLSPEGIFAIILKAKAININPLDALNGGMYYVQGKVELSAFMMTQLIRQAGHSIIKDEQSNDLMCILHGKRKDTGDSWTETFSIDDAKRRWISFSFRDDMHFIASHIYLQSGWRKSICIDLCADELIDCSSDKSSTK